MFKWYSKLIPNKYNSVEEKQKKRVCKPVSEEIVKEALRFAENNLVWGYDHIIDIMKFQGYDVSVIIYNILDAHGIVSNPECRQHGDWL